MFVTVLAALSAVQGEAIEINRASEPGLNAVEILWNKRRIPFVRSDEQWFTVLGVDLEAQPGEHEARLVFHYRDGSTRDETETINVGAKEFPTTRLTVEPKYVELSPENQARSAAEREEINAIYQNLTPQAYWQEPFKVPIPGTMGGRNFGHRRVFNDQPRAPHSGADLTAATGTQIQAANRGRVVLAKELFYSGNAVFIDHGLGVYTVYLHLSEIGVEVGMMVDKGEVIGLAGATGRVTGPHLHWGVRILDARVDPFSLLELNAAY
jgi:murein DD-endopeptidase MepM/ murein hydrolase activator NlpD